MPPRKSRKEPGDSIFAAEMAGLVAERRQREEADREEFRKAWAQRTAKKDPPLLPSTMHVHDDDCWTAPRYGMPVVPGTIVNANIWYVQCRRTSAIREVPKP